MRNATRQIRTAVGGIRGAATVLRQEVNTLTATLRSAYDPANAATLEREGQIGGGLANSGPVAVNETWSRIRTDFAHYRVLWSREWTRSLVIPGFLAPILPSSEIQ